MKTLHTAYRVTDLAALPGSSWCNGRLGIPTGSAPPTSAEAAHWAP